MHKHVKRVNDIEILFGEKIPACRESKCLMTKLETVYVWWKIIDDWINVCVGVPNALCITEFNITIFSVKNFMLFYKWITVSKDMQ